MPPSRPLALLRALPFDAARSLMKQTLWQRRSASSAGASTSELDGHYDVIIIGAGIHGSCTAAELASRGQRVLLLEQYDLLHRRGSSHGESRITRRTYAQCHYAQMMATSYALWERSFAAAGCSSFTRTGGIDFGASRNRALAALRASAAVCGVAVEELTPEQVAARFPGLALPPGSEALWHAEAGVLNATKSVALFHQLARLRGARLVDRTLVLQLRPTTEGVTVETSRGMVTARRAVLAVGAWAKPMLHSMGVGVDGLRAVPVAVSYWRCKDAASAAQLAAARFPVAICYTGAGLVGGEAADAEFYVTPVLELPGLVKISLHLPEHLWGPPVEDLEARTMDAPVDVVRRIVTPFVLASFPGVDASAPASVDPCLYTMTSDHEFIIDAVPGSNGHVLLASACSGHGFKFGPLIGDICADLVTKGDTDLVEGGIGRFKLDRQGLQTTRVVPEQRSRL